MSLWEIFATIAKAKVLGNEVQPAAGAQADQRPVPSPT
jgi:hypothetical protein